MEQLASNIQLNTPTLPPLPATDGSNLSMMKDRLMTDYVITEQEAEKKKPEDIEKLYLKHEREVAKQVSSDFINRFSGAYSFGAYHLLPLAGLQIDNECDLRDDIKNNNLVQMMINKFAPSLYYNFGALLGPLALMMTTAPHIKIDQFKCLDKNGSGEAAEKTCEDGDQKSEVLSG